MCHKIPLVLNTSQFFPHSWLTTGFVKIKIKINTTGATSGAGTGYASESPEFTRGL